MNKGYLRYAAFFGVPFLVIKVMTLAEEPPANDKKTSRLEDETDKAH